MESIKEGNQCEKCKKLGTNGFVVRFRKELGINEYLCSKCYHRVLGDYDKKCCKCDKKNDDGSFEMPRYNGKDMCSDCIQKEELKKQRREAIKIRIKKFAKDHWKFWISTSIAIIFGIIGISLI